MEDLIVGKIHILPAPKDHLLKGTNRIFKDVVNNKFIIDSDLPSFMYKELNWVRYYSYLTIESPIKEKDVRIENDVVSDYSSVDEKYDKDNETRRKVIATDDPRWQLSSLNKISLKNVIVAYNNGNPFYDVIVKKKQSSIQFVELRQPHWSVRDKFYIKRLFKQYQKDFSIYRNLQVTPITFERWFNETIFK